MSTEKVMFDRKFAGPQSIVSCFYCSYAVAQRFDSRESIKRPIIKSKLHFLLLILHFEDLLVNNIFKATAIISMLAMLDSACPNSFK